MQGPRTITAVPGRHRCVDKHHTRNPSRFRSSDCSDARCATHGDGFLGTQKGERNNRVERQSLPQVIAHTRMARGNGVCTQGMVVNQNQARKNAQKIPSTYRLSTLVQKVWNGRAANCYDDCASSLQMLGICLRSERIGPFKCDLASCI